MIPKFSGSIGNAGRLLDKLDSFLKAVANYTITSLILAGTVKSISLTLCTSHQE